MAKIKALPVSVYRDSGMDCTNHGISSKFDRLYVVCPDGHCDIDEDDPQLIKIVKRNIGYKTIYHAEPYKDCPKGSIGWMAGGNFVSTCDGRFDELVDGMYGAISLHDRCETPQQYEALSR